jgi:hypothetical protein
VSKANPALLLPRVSIYKGKSPTLRNAILDILEYKSCTTKEIVTHIYGEGFTKSNRSSVTFILKYLRETKQVAYTRLQSAYIYRHKNTHIRPKEKFYRHGHNRTLRNKVLEYIVSGVHHPHLIAMHLYGEITCNSKNKTYRALHTLKEEGLIIDPSRGYWVISDFSTNIS